jgi:hypothetical protein
MRDVPDSWSWRLAAALVIAGATTTEASLAVSPSRIVLSVKASKSASGFYTVENRGQEPLSVIVEPEDWTHGAGGARGTVKWLTVRPREFTLSPGQSRKVKYFVRVPKDAHGELRTQVFFTMKTVSGSSSIQSRLGTIIYVGVSGTERIEAAFTAVEAIYSPSTPGISAPDRMDILLRIHNLSNAHIVPEGTVRIMDERQELVATIPLPPGWGLLPNEEDAYHAISQNVHVAPGRYTMEVSIFCGGDLRHPVRITKKLSMEIMEDWRVQLQEQEPADRPPSADDRHP